MTSQKIEDVHKSDLEKLLLDFGVVCIRSVAEIEESASTSGESEKRELKEIEKEEVSEETIFEEEETTNFEETIGEETPEIFPTPSLRQVLPEYVRIIEKQNRIHVLPETFNNDIDPEKIPKIGKTTPQKYIDDLAEITGCKKYKNNLAEFWFLDTLANLLRRAQEDRLDKPTQAVLILWFCEWMKEMQYFDAADRNRMMRRFKDNMLSAAKFIASEDRIPNPTEVGVHYMAENNDLDGRQHKQLQAADTRNVTFESSSFYCSLLELTKIIHYIFDLFSSDFQYDLVRSVFTFSPEYNIIDASHHLWHPKRLFTPFKPKKREKSPKKEQKAVKGKKKEVDTEEYLHLLKVQADIEREQEEIEEKDQMEMHRRNHLLPLSFAIDDQFFNKYWPPPPEPIVELEPEVKGKGKKEKK